MRKDPSYLARMHMRVLGAHDEDIDPRPSIGRPTVRPTSPSARIPATGMRSAISRSTCRISMRSTCTTPIHARLFADDYRFDSHGCTRVDNVRDLAAWILAGRSAGLERAAIDAGIAAGVLKVVNLPHRIPVAWVDLTGWVTRDGTVQFREDVYKHDEALDRNALAEAAAGGFVAPLPPRDVKQAAPPPPREVKQVQPRQPLSRRYDEPAVPDIRHAPRADTSSRLGLPGRDAHRGRHRARRRRDFGVALHRDRPNSRPAPAAARRASANRRALAAHLFRGVRTGFTGHGVLRVQLRTLDPMGGLSVRWLSKWNARCGRHRRTAGRGENDA